jgi:hypothetical protein
LTVPRGPHGGEKRGLFSGKQDAQWVQLRDWVRLAAQPKEPSDEDEVSAAPLQSPMALRPASAETPGGDIHRSVFSPAPAEKGPTSAAPAPRDPFDPEIFNRRYHPEKSTPSTANVPDEAASKN